jgi:hypothetical protein
MINDVRNTVLSIISKDNRGFITPFEFNLFAKQAQLEIFGQYVYNYSNAINKQNARMHGEGYTDIPKNMAEVIDTFSVFTSATYNTGTSKFNFPVDPLTNVENYFFLDKLVYNNSTEIEKVSHRKILNLVNANLTAPTTSYPVYTMDETGLLVYPTTINSNVTIQYLRYPKDPNWTYSTTPLGDPLFNPGAPTYQDFELPLDDFANLVIKILEYSGISIREQDVVSAAKAEEVQDIQQKQ